MKCFKLLALCLLCFSCGKKDFTSPADITLPPGQKLVNASIVDGEVWYLTREMNTLDSCEIYIFAESRYSVSQDAFVIKETR